MQRQEVLITLFLLGALGAAWTLVFYDAGLRGAPHLGALAATAGLTALFLLAPFLRRTRRRTVAPAPMCAECGTTILTFPRRTPFCLRCGAFPKTRASAR